MTSRGVVTSVKQCWCRDVTGAVSASWGYGSVLVWCPWRVVLTPSCSVLTSLVFPLDLSTLALRAGITNTSGSRIWCFHGVGMWDSQGEHPQQFMEFQFLHATSSIDQLKNHKLAETREETSLLRVYRRAIPKVHVTTPITFGFSTQRGPLLSGNRYLLVAVTFR